MNKTLEFQQLVLPKEEVKNLSARHKKRLLMLTNMIRDMVLFRKMLIYARKQKTGHKELDESALTTIVFSISKILISKIYEIWKFIDNENIRQERVKFSGSLDKWWDEVEVFFSGEGVAKTRFLNENLVLSLIEKQIVENDIGDYRYIYFNKKIKNETQLRKHLKYLNNAEIDSILTIWRQSYKNSELFRFVRNNFGFHFGYDQKIEPYIEKAMNEIGDLEFWMDNGTSENDIFSSSNAVMLIVLRNKMCELGFIGSAEDLIGQLQKLPIEISYRMNEFCKGYLTEVLLKGMSFLQGATVTITASLLSEVTLPLIVKNDLQKSE